ncbi:MAG: cupin domain-containing protein [Chloroflexi bacterium]|nr:cupin domain-containing protein [Chloroflexota bacterium]
MDVFTWDELEQRQSPTRNTQGAALVGDAIEVNRALWPAGQGPKLHSHPHEQIISVLSGAMRVFVDGEEAVIRPGDVVHIPSNVPHRVESIEDSYFLSLKNLVGGKGSEGERHFHE